MLISFELSMPGRNSWNGRWGGEEKLHAAVVNFGKTNKGTEKAQKIIKAGYFRYSFGDGWSAGVSAREVDSKQAAKIRRKSSGFCGYDWMVESIKDHLEIRGDK